MNYTERDIEKAIRLKLEGYNWIATNKNGRPFAYGRMPYRCADDSNEYNIWDNQPGTPWLMLSKDEFTSITWENEPVYIDEIITGGKVQANGDTAIDRLTAENAELKTRLERAIELPFSVIDKKTGEVADVCNIALKEEWAKHLIYCDIDSFAIKEDGTLILIDDCNNIAYCPYDRFEIKAKAQLAELKGDGE